MDKETLDNARERLTESEKIVTKMIDSALGDSDEIDIDLMNEICSLFLIRVIRQLDDENRQWFRDCIDNRVNLYLKIFGKDE